MRVGITLTIAAVTIALAACGPSTSSSTPASDASTEPDVSAIASTTATADGETVGDPVDAAVRYVASTDSLMAHSPVGRVEIFTKLVVAAAVAGQVEAFERGAASMAAKVGVPVERLVWVEAPLTATLVAGTAESASVDVWTVSVLGVPDVGSPQQVWRTVHVTLKRSGDRWLVATATADAGPTPAANELAMQANWDEFETVASWTQVVEGADL